MIAKNMKDEVFRKRNFTASALDALRFAQNLAFVQEAEQVFCWHLLASIVYQDPNVVRDILGKDMRDMLVGYESALMRAKTENRELDFAAELSALLLDTTEQAPLTFINNNSLHNTIGLAELVFILLSEPTQDISELLSPAEGVCVDYNSLYEKLCTNYLSCGEKYSGITARDRMKKCIEKGRIFSEYMNRNLVGQEAVIDSVTNALINFWYKGNQLRPLTILLVAKSGGGKTFFAQKMQEGFVEIGLQNHAIPSLDMSCFAHYQAADSELLGDGKSYTNARAGKLYENSKSDRRGVMVFENMLQGCDTAKRIMTALTQNNAYDKFHEKNLFLPFKVLLFTLTLSEAQYDFLTEKAEPGRLDPQLLGEILRKSNRLEGSDFALLNAMQECILLKDLSREHLEKMIENELNSVAEDLDRDYQLSFDCPAKNDFIQLLMQSVPHKITPKDLVAIMKRHLSGIDKVFFKHPDIEKVEIHCETLPDYPHDPDRRTIRGDYLVFSKKETFENQIYTIEFCNIKYVCQENIDCDSYRIARPKNLKLDDIVGLDSLKRDLCDALDYITGKAERTGLPPPPLAYILHGEPGTGKTATICALASSCDIPVFFANSSIFSDATKLDDLFTKAKRMAPAIVVLDELNSIGRSSQAWRVDVINTLLAHMDGIEESSKIMVLGSTNYVEQIEVALRRPGRFSQIVHVGLPEAGSREQYIRKFEERYKFELSGSDRDFFVALTSGKSIAVIKGVLEYALRTSSQKGENLNAAALEYAYEHIVAQTKKEKSRSIGFNGGEAC